MHTLVSRILRAASVAAAAVLVVTPAYADSTPIGALPKVPVATISTHRGLLVALALPHPARGLVWRLARPVDPKVVREISEANVGKNVVVVFAATGTGHVSVVFALTRGDASAKAEGATTHLVRVT